MVSDDTEDKKKDAQLDDTFHQFIEEFANETDRAAVVLGAAKLDLLLYQIIQLYFFPTTGSKDELLDGDSPLGTFSSKINIAYRLGLIDSNFVRALHLIRKIRNSFAHEVGGCTLETGAHRDRTRELAAIFKPYSKFSKMRDALKDDWDKDGAALDFRVVLGIIVVRLETIFVNIKQITQDDCIALIPPKWHKHKN